MKIKKLCLLLFLCSALVISALSCKNEVAKPLDLGSIKSSGLICTSLTGTKDTATNKYIKVDFAVSAVENATRYCLYYSESNDPNTAILIADSLSNSSLSAILDYSLKNHDVYFWARATNGYKYTDYTNAIMRNLLI